MPLMRWNEFHEAHYRPSVVFADFEGVRYQAAYELIGRLIGSLDLIGNYALQPEPECIRLAFERDVDAEKFASVVSARRVIREEDRWALQWSFRMNGSTEKTMRALLSDRVRKSSGPRGRRLRGRSFPS